MIHSRYRGILGYLAAAVMIMGAAPSKATKPFYLKPGDTVVFYGDSITDQRLYTNYIESYCVSRFPKAHYTFIHSGWGGDRVTGGGGGPISTRLKRDVLAYKPTVVTICLGMNDGSYRAFDDGIFKTYVDGYRHIIETLKKELPGVRITLLTAPAYDDVTRAANFLGGYNATLVAYGEAVRTLANEYGLTVADTNAPLVGALARAHAVDAELSTTIIRDRVHPGQGGHVVMAAAVLKAWNAPETVASFEIDAASSRVIESTNSSVSSLSVKGGVVSFVENDKVLPWPIDRDITSRPDTNMMLRVTDIESTLNKYLLKVKGLTAPEYSISYDGKVCGTATKEALESGIDLASLADSPANLDARKLLGLTYKHNDIHFKRWRQVQITRESDGLNPSTDVKMQMDALDKEEAATVVLQQAAAQTHSHKVTITPAH